MQGFIFGSKDKDKPWTYEELQRKREIAETLAASNLRTPQNVGEGLASIGRALMYRKLDKRAGSEEARMKQEFDNKWGSVFGGYGGGASPAAAYASTPSPSSAPPVDPSSPAGLGDAAMAALGKPAQHDHGAHPGQSHAEWLKYSNQGATRNDPLDPKLIDAMSFVGDMGITMDVVSGGQEAAGQGGARTGSTRHDLGNAADVDFYKDGRKLDWNNPNDLPILTEIVKTAKSRGVTGIGAGDDYMGAGRFHVGFGNPGVWGAGGKGANAPAWLVEAYNGSPSGAAPAAPVPQGGMSGGMDIGALVGLASDPMASPAQKAIIETLIQQQLQAADPLRAIQMQKAQLELDALRNPAEKQTDFDIRAAEAAQYGMEPGTPEYQQFVLTGELPKAAGAGGTEYGLTPQYGTDADGNLVAIQFAKDGTSIATPLPEGVALSKGIEKLDLGTHYQYVNSITGEKIGEPVSKNLAEAEAQKAIGKAEGEAVGAASTGLGAAESQAKEGMALIQSIIDDPALPSITGMFQGRMPPLTQAGTDLNEKIKQVKGKAFLEAFESLKGGGAISEREGEAATQAIARLERAQSDEAYIEALTELQGILQTGLNNMRAKAGGGTPAANDLGLSEDDLKYLE